MENKENKCPNCGQTMLPWSRGTALISKEPTGTTNKSSTTDYYRCNGCGYSTAPPATETIANFLVGILGHNKQGT